MWESEACSCVSDASFPFFSIAFWFCVLRAGFVVVVVVVSLDFFCEWGVEGVGMDGIFFCIASVVFCFR